VPSRLGIVLSPAILPSIFTAMTAFSPVMTSFPTTFTQRFTLFEIPIGESADHLFNTTHRSHYRFDASLTKEYLRSLAHSPADYAVDTEFREELREKPWLMSWISYFLSTENTASFDLRDRVRRAPSEVK
jgi:hypothetical protein